MGTRILTILLLSLLFHFSSFSQSCVDFESLVLGATYGSPGNQPGDIIFTENGIPVSVEYFYPTAVDTAFDFCEIVDPVWGGFGTGNVMVCFAINLKFDYAGLAFTVNRVTLDLKDFSAQPSPWGNIAINGEPVYFGEFTNYSPPPGFTFVIDYIGQEGTITIRGPVNTLLFGGVELEMDDICAEDSTLSNVSGNFGELPKTFLLNQNFPNPFNPNTLISFSIPETGHTKLDIYDVLGNFIITLINEELPPGKYESEFTTDAALPSGIYFYKLTSGYYVETRKMVLLK